MLDDTTLQNKAKTIMMMEYIVLVNQSSRGINQCYSRTLHLSYYPRTTLVLPLVLPLVLGTSRPLVLLLYYTNLVLPLHLSASATASLWQYRISGCQGYFS